MNRYAKIALAGVALIAVTATAARAVGPGGGPDPMGGPGFGPCGGPAAEDGFGPGHRGHWRQANIDRQLGVDDVRAIVAGRLAMRGNKRLKVGNVQEKDADTVTAEIVTVDNSLVERLAIDRHTGRPTPVR